MLRARGPPGTPTYTWQNSLAESGLAKPQGYFTGWAGGSSRCLGGEQKVGLPDQRHSLGHLFPITALATLPLLALQPCLKSASKRLNPVESVSGMFSQQMDCFVKTTLLHTHTEPVPFCFRGNTYPTQAPTCL